jgi:exopolyphosphatase / guanosine-5'-triphosphate,3'-diphosphate pyrophosphatase
MRDGTALAAIDLGSNSFRLQLGVYDNGEVYRTDYFKETVRQGQLDALQNITQNAFKQGIECLSRFAERVRGMEKHQLRVVATQTLREAKNRQSFIDAAQAVLGFPIDVISGREEARLIFSGCSHLLPQIDAPRLVVDIGGRSTEVVRGLGHEANEMESYAIGSVGLSQQYFADGVVSTQNLAIGKLAAMSVLEEIGQRFVEFKGAEQEVYGCSGTFGAICDILDAAHGSPTDLPHSKVITREGLNWIKSRMVRAGHVDQLHLDSLKPDRRAVLPAGVCLVDAVFELLSIDQIVMSEGALRHGVLYDLIERSDPTVDRRARSVQWLVRKFSVDTMQAERVSQAAVHLFKQLAADLPQHERLATKLSWAAQLHEIGTRISHESSHKHGAYIVKNANITGFSIPELERLSMLVLGHKGKLKKLEFAMSDQAFVLQLACLRLAVLLCHARVNPDLSGLTISREHHNIVLNLPQAWSDRYPQSRYLIDEEVCTWKRSGLTWRLKTI